MKQYSTEQVVEIIKRQVCFDALRDHELYALVRVEKGNPFIVGRCDNHGGKCTELLELIAKLELGELHAD